MVYNYDLITPILEFRNPDEFYYLQLIQRKKENEDLGSNSRVVKTYYVNNLEYWNKIQDEIQAICNATNSRAYIHLSKRSYEKCTFHTLKLITDQILNKDYFHSKKAFNSVCGKYASGDKLWIIDVDNKEINYEILVRLINNCSPIYPRSSANKFVTKIPTKNGYHIISRPFNLKEFTRALNNEVYGQEVEEYNEIKKYVEVHKNNPTVLYIL